MVKILLSSRRTPLFSILVCLSFLLLASSSIQAMPLTEYQKNLQRAITALDTLTQQDEEESDSDYDRRLRDTTEAIRVAIPATQMVESGQEIYSVQNSWLHNQLGELEKAVASDRQERISEMLDCLRALDERISDAQGSHTSTDQSNAKQKLEAILRRAEYQSESKGSSAIARLLRDFFRWLENLFPKGYRLRSEDQARSVSRVAQFVAFGLCVIVIVFVLKTFLPRVLRRRTARGMKKAEPRIILGERIAPEQSAHDLLSEAEQLARDGQLRPAIRKAYIALLVELGDRKLISLAQHKTNRDYLNSVRNAPSLYSNLRGLTDRFERHWYGSVQATQDDWQEFRAVYLATLGPRS